LNFRAIGEKAAKILRGYIFAAPGTHSLTVEVLFSCCGSHSCVFYFPHILISYVLSILLVPCHLDISFEHNKFTHDDVDKFCDKGYSWCVIDSVRDNYNLKFSQTVQQHVSYEFIWICRTCDHI